MGQHRGMDTPRDDATPAGRAAAWLQATRAELVGLAVLLVGALVATGLLWLQATGRPLPGASDGLPASAADLGRPVDGASAGGVAGGLPGEPAGGLPGELAGDLHGGPAHAADHAGVGGDAAEVTVHVTGAVSRPGVVTLPPGARVIDALDAAGGAGPDAALERLNLARVLDDGEHVHLPRPDEEPPVPVDGAAASAGVLADGRIDLNRASQEDLETLPGIGPAKAAAIIDHRDRVGSFSVPGDLRDVPGIGEATFQRLAELLVVR